MLDSSVQQHGVLIKFAAQVVAISTDYLFNSQILHVCFYFDNGSYLRQQQLILNIDY